MQVMNVFYGSLVLKIAYLLLNNTLLPNTSVLPNPGVLINRVLVNKV